MNGSPPTLPERPGASEQDGNEITKRADGNENVESSQLGPKDVPEEQAGRNLLRFGDVFLGHYKSFRHVRLDR